MQIPDSPRILIRAVLQPLQGTRFQPTGFPDIGAATYQLADGTEMLLVESQQSVANHLESVCWDKGAHALVPALKGMPYVDVHTPDGSPLTSSLLEAHRLNSVYIEKSDFFKEQLKKRINHDKSKPTNLRTLASALAHYDPNSLVHGTFLESIAGTLRLPRMLSGFVEARNVRVVAAGGVKNDIVTPSTKDTDRKAAEGYGNVPFHRDEYTAESLTAYFNLDLNLLNSFGLSAPMNRFLTTLSLWKVRAFLDEGLRLRTACDLDVVTLEVTRPDSFELPTRTALAADLQQLITEIGQDKDAFGDSPTIATYTGK